MPGKSVVKFPGHVSFLGAAGNNDNNLLPPNSSEQSTGQQPSNPFWAQTRGQIILPHKSYPILFPALSLLKRTLHLGPGFSYLNQMRKTDLLKGFICFSFPDLSSRDWLMLHLREITPREAEFWCSWCILVLSLSFNHTGSNLTWLCARTDAQAHSSSSGAKGGSYLHAEVRFYLGWLPEWLQGRFLSCTSLRDATWFSTRAARLQARAEAFSCLYCLSLVAWWHQEMRW